MQKSIILFSIIVVYFFMTISSAEISYADTTIVKLNKSMYLDGENIIISGIVPDYRYYPVSIEIKDPTGRSINTHSVVPINDFEYSLSVETRGQIWKHDGVYTVIVSHASIPQSETRIFEFFHTVPSPKPFNAGEIGVEHAQAKLVVKIYDDMFNFTQPQFQKQSPWIRFEDDGETIHRYASGVPLGFLFETIGMSGQDDACYRFQGGKVYCTNAYYTFKFYINKKSVSKEALRDYVIQDGDEIRIIYDDQIVAVSPEIIIPDWIRDVAGFWCKDQIDEISFIGGIEYLIQNQIIIVPVEESETNSTQAIPSWIKNNACWWSDGQISDKDFASGLEFLIKQGIIQV